MEKFPITVKGAELIRKEIRHLENIERPQITAAIASARELGDLSENAEYHSAREKQSFIEGKIQTLGDQLARAVIIDIKKLGGEQIKFGATVGLLNLDNEEEVKYIIAGEYEANIEKNIISIRSPVAKALIGKEIGDSVEVSTPRGSKSYEIISIEFCEFDI